MIFITHKLNKVLQREENKFNLSNLINEKNFTKSDTPLTYRQINTLSKDELFPEENKNISISLSGFDKNGVIDELKSYGTIKKDNELIQRFNLTKKQPEVKKNDPKNRSLIVSQKIKKISVCE